MILRHSLGCFEHIFSVHLPELETTQYQFMSAIIQTNKLTARNCLKLRTTLPSAKNEAQLKHWKAFFLIFLLSLQFQLRLHLFYSILKVMFAFVKAWERSSIVEFVKQEGLLLSARKHLHLTNEKMSTVEVPISVSKMLLQSGQTWRLMRKFYWHERTKLILFNNEKKETGTFLLSDNYAHNGIKC